MLWFLVCFSVLSIDTDIVYGGEPVKHNHAITVHKILSTWDEARDHCRREGGLLASPVDSKTVNAMKSLMNVDKMYHIGIRAGHSSGTYLSLEGMPLENMTEAMDNMIEELDPLSGDCMSMDQKSIRFIPCWTRLQHLCYNTNHSISDINCNTDARCGEKDYKYQLPSRKCYKVGHDMTWVEAAAACTAEGGRLAVVENENDKQSILNMKELFFNWLFIRSLQDRTVKAGWKSIDDRRVEDLLNVWKNGAKPNPAYKCGAMYETGDLAFTDCSYRWHYICEKEPRC